MADTQGRMAAIVSRYGDDPRHVLAIMQDMQGEFGHVPREGLEALSRRFSIPMGQLYAQATFYKALSLEPKGRHVIRACAGTTCHIRGGENIEAGVTRELGIRPGETTDDGRFTLEEVHCLGACALAPIMMVDDDLYGRVSLEDLPGILARYGEEGEVSP